MGQRKQARLALAQLADLTTLSDSTLNRIERGLQRPSVRALKLISAAFNMPVETLLAEGAPGLEVVPERPYEQTHNAYYTCKSCGLNIRIEPLIEALVLPKAGGRVLREKRVVYGDDRAAEIARLEQAAERRRELLADEPGDEDMKASLTKMEAQIAALRNRPREPDSFQWREAESGTKVADHLAALDRQGARSSCATGK